MNPGVDLLMTIAGFGARFAPRPESQRSEMRGLKGKMNLELVDGEGGWHLEFDEADVTIGRGLAADARATVRVKAQDLFAMIAGDMQMSTARMTGRFRIAGDGHFGILFGGFVGALRQAMAAPGIAGFVARKMITLAMRRGGYVPRRPRPAGS
jgi:putative sterol carrier protein